MCGIKRNGLTIRYNQPYIALEAHACPFARQWAPAGTPRIRMTDSVWTPLLLSLKVAGWATALNLILGVGAAYGLARTRSRLRDLIDAALTLPLVLPPTVLGYYLLVLLGRRGTIGGWLDSMGIHACLHLARGGRCLDRRGVSAGHEVSARRI